MSEQGAQILGWAVAIAAVITVFVVQHRNRRK